MAISFDSDIRFLFRDSDVAAMTKARGLDLSSYAVVKARADDILHRLRLGDMPCDAPWSQGKIDLFAQWISDGKQP